jgi:hypothetical protein
MISELTECLRLGRSRLVPGSCKAGSPNTPVIDFPLVAQFASMLSTTCSAGNTYVQSVPAIEAIATPYIPPSLGSITHAPQSPGSMCRVLAGLCRVKK